MISVSDNGTALDKSDDVVLYSAPSGYSGTDSFTYTITDLNGDASEATVMITVSGLPPSSDPTVMDDSFSVLEDSTNNDLDILDNDSFGSEGAGSITLSVGSNGGTLAINDNTLIADATDDTVTYTPVASFVGVETFTYTLTDAGGDTSAAATVTIAVGTVIPPSTTPTAVDDNVSVIRFSTNNLIDVMDNDDFGFDGKNPTHPLTLSNGRSTGTSAGGRFIQVHDSGTPLDFSDDTVSYSPGSLLTDSFEYTITDGNGDATTGTVYITTTSLKEVASVSVGSNKVFENNFLAYPNPSRGNVKTTLLSKISTKATLFLSDVTGKIIDRRVLEIKKGVNQLEFDFTVKSGLMLMKIMSSEVDYGTSKIVFK